MDTLRFRITGTSPLLMHNSRMADPLDSFVQQIKQLTSKGKKKTDEDHEQIAWLEYQGGIYFDDKIGVYVPSLNIEAAIREAAKLQRCGKDIQRGVQIFENAPLVYDGPKTVVKLYKDGFHLKTSVGISASRTMRCRPCFKQWGAEFDVMFNPEVIKSRDELVNYVKTAGDLTGIGDWRPRYGRFSTEVLS